MGWGREDAPASDLLSVLIGRALQWRRFRLLALYLSGFAGSSQNRRWSWRARIRSWHLVRNPDDS